MADQLTAPRTSAGAGPDKPVEPGFLAAAHKPGRPVTVQTVKPLPPSDPLGAVASLLLLPLLVGGLLAAIFVFKAARGIAAAPWRAAIHDHRERSRLVSHEVFSC